MCVQAAAKVDFRMSWLGMASLGLIAIAMPAFAHHGAAAFDPNKEITLRGTVTDFAFSNPHVQVFFEAIGDHGEKEAWQGELTAPNKLIRAGWSKRTLKPGDPITITGFQAWRGERVLWIRKMIGPRGQPLPLGED
jgi:hypothetical protein